MIDVPLSVQGLYLSPAHNFFGHTGRDPGRAPMVASSSVECVAGRGLRGDRFFDYRPDYKGGVTFFSLEVFEQLQRDLSLPHAPPWATRRNVFVRGGELSSLIGKQFELQGVRFEGTEECRPCYWMEQALGPGAEIWLKGRGGLRARILTSGILSTAAV
jgi:MOSC domain-containing protein YiiM